MMNRIEHIEREISELRTQLQNHTLYENLSGTHQGMIHPRSR